jgi:hypothetical protein
MKKYFLILILIFPSLTFAKWFDTKTNTYFETQAEACTAAAAWYCSTYGWGGCGYDGIVDVNAPGSYPWYRDCQVYRTTPSHSTYNSQINGYPLCDDPEITANTDYDCIASKDCFDLYNDLDIGTPEIECTCVDGHMPIETAGNFSCDGVRPDCINGSYEEIFEGHTIKQCQSEFICNPATDPDGCGLILEPECDTEEYTEDGECVKQLVDNTVPDHCPVGYFYDSNTKKCHPITDIKVDKNTSTGEKNIKTSYKDGDVVITNNTNQSFGNQSDSDQGEGEQNEPLTWVKDTTKGLFDMDAANAELENVKNTLSSTYTQIKSEIDSIYTSTITNGGETPQNLVTLFGNTYDLSLSKFVPKLADFGLVILFLAALVAFSIIMIGRG